MSLLLRPQLQQLVVVETGEEPPRPRRWITRGRVAAGLLLLWALSGIFLVGTDQQAVVSRFGRFVRIETPGIHYHWPYPIEQAAKLRVEQLQAATLGGEPADAPLGRTDPLRAQFLTGDQNIINVRAVAQYNVKAPREYLWQSQDVARLVAVAVESELGREIAGRGVDDVLTTERVKIQEAVKQRAQALVDSYQVGVSLFTVSIERAGPPEEAREAFAEVAGARADAVRIINQAEGYSNDVVPRARGEGEQLLAAAQAHKQRRINEAAGDASRFTLLAAEYSKAAAVTSHRLYIEAMEQILPRIKKTIVDRQGNTVDLTIIRGEGETPRPPVPR